MDRLALRLEKHHALPVVLFQPDLVHLQIHRLSLQSGWCWWWLWWILFTSIADNWTKYRIFVYCPVIRSVPQITIIPTLSMLSKSRKNKCREEYLFWAFGEIPFQQTRKFLSHYIWDSWTIGPLNAVCVSKSRYWTHFTSEYIDLVKMLMWLHHSEFQMAHDMLAGNTFRVYIKLILRFKAR